MNLAATRQQLDRKAISLAKWARNHDLNYYLVRSFLYGSDKPMFTRKQMEVVEALRADGLLVEDEEKEAA